jgi:hypothetical protein
VLPQEFSFFRQLVCVPQVPLGRRRSASPTTESGTGSASAKMSAIFESVRAVHSLQNDKTGAVLLNLFAGQHTRNWCGRIPRCA